MLPHLSPVTTAAIEIERSSKQTMKNSAALAAWTSLALGTLVHAATDGVDPALPSQRRLRGRTTGDLTGIVATHNSDDNTLRQLQGSCILEGNLYGNVQGTLRSVEFLYQGVFQEGTSQTQIIRNILPPFERDLAQGILPAFFACPTDQPTGAVTGVSPLEDDSLVVGSKYSSFQLGCLQW